MPKPGGRSAKSKGTYAEQAVKAYMQTRGWVVVRAWSSIGPWDLLALRPDRDPAMVQVKSGASGAYMRPSERFALVTLAHKAGADAVMAYYPRDNRGMRGATWHRLLDMSTVYDDWSPE